MKKSLIIIVLFFIASMTIAQSDSKHSDSLKTNDCSWFKNEVDEFTATTKKVLNSEKFISHTDSSLIKYYKKKPYDYLEVDCNFAKINDLYVMYWTITIRTKKAYEYYGSIREGAKVIFILEDAGTLELKFSKFSNGDTDYNNSITTYKSYIILEDWQLQILDKQKINKARVYWSKGYNDYKVINQNIAINQLNCLY